MATIHTDIFHKRFTTTPPTISDPILRLCREISPSHKPGYVTVAPEPDAKISECFGNVEAKVKAAGGSILYGWSIWMWPRVFIEAEHHAVWQNGDDLIDVTPHENGERRILFLPDPDRTYDSVNHQRLINVKRSLGELHMVDEFIAASDRLMEYVEACSDGLAVNMDQATAAVLHRETQHAMAGIILQLASRLRPHDPCLCISGRKFRKCCGPLIDLTPIPGAPPMPR